MIRAAGRLDDGQPFMLLGLTRSDIDLLLGGDAIIVDCAAPLPAGLGIPGAPAVSILAAETEQQIADRLAQLGTETLDGE